jgi:serine protease Do
MTPMGPLPHVEPPKSGMPTVFKVFIVLGALMFVFMAAAFAVGIVMGFRRASQAPSRTGALPPVERHVPEHEASLLDGCSSADVDAIVGDIGSAIDVGAPLYNAGDFAGCYHMYDGTASDLERKLSATCAGPKKALAAGQARASTLRTPSAQAWAMRDAFDGLLDVTQRAR